MINKKPEKWKTFKNLNDFELQIIYISSVCHISWLQFHIWKESRDLVNVSQTLKLYDISHRHANNENMG